jgi:hypothetical protein
MKNNSTTAPSKPKEKERTTTKRPGLPDRNPNPGEKIKPKA